MKTVKVELGSRSYPIWIDSGATSQVGSLIKKAGVKSRRILLLSNRKVFNLYGEKVLQSLESAGFEVCVKLIPEGEKSKSLNQAAQIYSFMLKNKFTRQSALLALGGGIVGDLGGYIAASFLRGIEFIQVPTSLLAQVDSSVGGKVAVNLDQGKNLVGFFYQPKCVIIDPACLKTLSQKEVKCGLSEVIKYGFIWDKSFFNFLIKNVREVLSLDQKTLIKIIAKSVFIKAAVVASDEQEKGLRAILNFGHTFGHSIEKVWGYKVFSHGEAVAMGMGMACALSYQLGALSLKDFKSSIDVLTQFKLKLIPSETKKQLSEISKNLYYDKKMTDKGLVFILIKQIGEVYKESKLDPQVVKTFIESYPKFLKEFLS